MKKISPPLLPELEEAARTMQLKKGPVIEEALFEMQLTVNNKLTLYQKPDTSCIIKELTQLSIFNIIVAN